MRFSTLDDWLSWQEGLHPSEIDLGLARVHEVLCRLGRDKPAHPVVTVAGTNGKGSSVTLLAAIYRAAGYRVGAFTSPHLLRYNERIRIDGEEVADELLCQTFERIDQARGEISLTYFEFGALAAIDCFAAAEVDVAILEVGLGGRLDAVNIIDADVALITSIGVDHEAWLGSDRETIGREKAGIMRAGCPVVCGDPDPPASIASAADALGARLYAQGVDFDIQRQQNQWRWRAGSRCRDALPMPALRGRYQLQNAAAVLMVVELLARQLPVSQAHLREGLGTARLAGRFQVLPGAIPLILDVAHNPQAGEALAGNLRAWPTPGETHAVVAMMADKNMVEIFSALIPEVDHWHLTGIDTPRAAPPEQLEEALTALGQHQLTIHASVAQAIERVRAGARAHDRIVVFGSFYTVAEAMAAAYTPSGPVASESVAGDGVSNIRVEG